MAEQSDTALEMALDALKAVANLANAWAIDDFEREEIPLDVIQAKLWAFRERNEAYLHPASAAIINAQIEETSADMDRAASGHD